MLSRLAALIRRLFGRPRGRMVECAACGGMLPVAKATILHGEISRDREGFATTVAEYHRRCAPKDA